jgi:RNA polymerase sigma factor (sigma-70 family)
MNATFDCALLYACSGVPLDKNEFMRACREGGASIEKALRSLDRHFFATLHARAHRVLRNADAARDLVQETFIKVWQRCGTFQGSSELLPWIDAILRHGVLDFLRRGAREVPFDDSNAVNTELSMRIVELSQRDVPTPDDEARREQLADCFRRCWARFEEAAPAHAAVISWIADDGLTHDEIGALLERSPGATREFISQCRKRARVHLAEWYELAFGGKDSP